MSAMATAQERDSILKQLTDTLQASPDVTGIVLVGSGAIGFKDSFSDIDLVVIVSEESVFKTTYNALKDSLMTAFKVSYHFETHITTEDTNLIMMLNNFLEVDLYIAKKRVLAIRDKTWKILHDPTEEVDHIIGESFSQTLMIAPRRLYLQVVERIWQPILECVSALNRNETWKALYTLEQIRNQTVHLAGINHHVETGGFNGVDQLPEMMLINLRHTIPTSTSNVAIRRALRSTVTMFFTEAITLEQRLKLDFAQHMQAKLMPYIEAYS